MLRQAADARIAGTDSVDKRETLPQALVAQRPKDIGSDGIQQAYNAVTGKPVTAKITPPILPVTKDNVDSPSVAPFLYSTSCSES